MRKNRQYAKASDKCYIEISVNTNTLTSEIILKDNYPLLGFHSKLYTSEIHESENMVNILTIISIPDIDIISGSYVKGSAQTTIHSFFPNVSRGYKIIENPHNLLYLPITADTIHSIATWLTDQNRNEHNLR